VARCLNSLKRCHCFAVQVDRRSTIAAAGCYNAQRAVARICLEKPATMQAPGLGNGAGHRPEEDISGPASRGSDHLRRSRREENRKKEETLTLNPEENAPKEPSKTVVFKPANLRGFRNGADRRVPQAPTGAVTGD